MGKGGLYEANTWSNLYLHNNVFVAVSYGLGHVYSHPILTFKRSMYGVALLVHLFSVWIVKFQLNISEIEEGTFEWPSF